MVNMDAIKQILRAGSDQEITYEQMPKCCDSNPKSNFDRD